MRAISRTTSFATIAAGFVVLSAPALSAQNPAPVAPAPAVKTTPSHRAAELYGRLPLSFEANQGQADARVQFLSRGPEKTVFLTATQAVLVAHATGDALGLTLVGANSRPQVRGLAELPGKTNHFIGSDPGKWRTNVPTYAKVQYDDVYPGIDLVYYGNQRQLEYDLVVRPAANPDTILLRFEGAERLAVDAHGDLLLHTGAGVVRQKKPVIYQEVDQRTRVIAGSYVIKGPELVGFEIAEYDRSRPLVIDPVLVYSTYLGGQFIDEGRGIAVDGAGNVYVTGLTQSANFPTVSPLQATKRNPNGANAFVAKLDPAGTALLYSTFLGGTGPDPEEYGAAIAVDASGNAYVTGKTTSTDFPTVGAIQATHMGGNGDAFVAKLNANGSALLYSTYLGGGGYDYGAAIVVDAGANAYVAGRVGPRPSGSPNFPTTTGALQSSYGGGGSDGFVTKINPAGDALVYSTFVGGSNEDEAAGIAVDATGSAYVTGHTASANFPTTAGAFQPAYLGNGLYNAFVAKLNNTGSALAYSTYLGGRNSFGAGGDYGRAIAVDGSGNAYVTGETSSENFPTTVGALRATYPNATWVAFITKLNPTGTAPVYSTFLGAPIMFSFGRGIAVDSGGNAYVTGNVTASAGSTDFPTVDPIQAAHGGGPPSASDDAFVAKLNSAGNALVYSTYFGGDWGDIGRAIAVDSTGNAYITGSTRSTNLATVSPIQSTNGGGLSDAFIAKIGVGAGSASDLRIVKSIAATGVVVGGGFSATITVTNDGPDPAPNVVVQDTLSVGQQFAGSTGGNCSSTSASTVTCNLGTMAVGSSVTFYIDLTAQASGTLSDTAAVSYSGTDPDSSDNSASASVVVLPPPTVAGSGTAVIDGTLTPGEWDPAGCQNFNANLPNGGITPATLCMMNDIMNLYVSIRFDRTMAEPGSFGIEFDSNPDGLIGNGDDGFLYNNDVSRFYDNYRTTDPPCPAGLICGLEDDLHGGTSDGAGAFRHHGTFSVYELSHPLASGDSHDFSLCPGDEVGFFIHLRMMSAGGVWPTDFGDTWWPGPSQYAELQLSGECGTQTVAAGGTLTTDTESDGATPLDVVETTVTSPAPGPVSIAEAFDAGAPPSGYSFLGNAVRIAAPSAPAGQYLTIVFRLDASAIPTGTALGSIEVRRNGVAIATCMAVANPLPCVSRQWLPDGDAELTVYTAQASLWQFLLSPADVTPPSMTCSVTPNILWPPNNSLIPVVATVEVSDTESGADGFTLTSVTSDDGNSAGDMHGFTIGEADVTGMLRAARSGKAKNGRHYTLTYEGRDRAGNTASCSAVVTVPHDQRKH